MQNHCVLLYFVIVCQRHLLTANRDLNFHSTRRHERAVPLLLFPPTSPTRTQWIVGVGIPVENLLFETITTGYVLKVEYFLPETVEQLKYRHPMKIMRSSGDFKDLNELTNQTFWNSLQDKKRKVLSSYRWALYKVLEGLALRMGRSGRNCVLKSICEAGEVPFHHWNGLFGELLHILLTPSSSNDDMSEHADNDYFYAELVGRSGAECSRVFPDCRNSLLDYFSKIYSLEKDMKQLLF